jgi:hypothetical protein
MENKIFIYGLCSNDDNFIRYVGKSYRPNIRKNEHLSSVKRGVNTHKNNWIKKVIKSGGTITVQILEECSENDWPDKEKYWIKRFKNLTNVSEGGEGHSGKRFKTPIIEVKEWVSENLSGIDSETKWREYVKYNPIPKHIPKRPDATFKNNGWVSWGDFLNTNNKKYTRHLISYTELKIIANNVRLNDIKSWYDYASKNNLPINPQLTYKDKGWVSWDDFLGGSYKRTKGEIFYSYEKCKELLAGLSINSTTFKEYIKNNKIIGIPKSPSSFFRKRGTWLGWKDFLSL